jgi:hypothetical protein
MKIGEQAEFVADKEVEVFRMGHINLKEVVSNRKIRYLNRDTF